MQTETNWRTFINDREIHITICKSIVALQEKVLDAAERCDIISDPEIKIIQQDLEVAAVSDIRNASRVFTKLCTFSTPIRGRLRTQFMHLPWSIEDQKSDYFVENKNPLLFLKWRVREVAALSQYFTEVRNINNHDLQPRFDFAWKIVVPSTVLRILELCPEDPKDLEVYEKIRSICKEQIGEVVRPDEEELVEDDNISEEETAGYKIPEVSSDDLKKIDEKLENILEIVSTETYGKQDQLGKRIDEIEESVSQRIEFVEAVPPDLPIDFSKNEDLEGDEEQEENNTIDEYPSVELLTPQMVRNKLNSLAKEHKKNYKGFDFDVPAENILQIAVIEEILSNRPRNASEILTLPDVSWRLKEYKNSMNNQFKVLKPELEDILSRAVWDE